MKRFLTEFNTTPFLPYCKMSLYESDLKRLILSHSIIIPLSVAGYVFASQRFHCHPAVSAMKCLVVIYGMFANATNDATLFFFPPSLVSLSLSLSLLFDLSQSFLVFVKCSLLLAPCTAHIRGWGQPGRHALSLPLPGGGVSGVRLDAGQLDQGRVSAEAAG
jgi:hypothetical protein